MLQPNCHLANRSYFEGPLRDLSIAEELGVVSYLLAGGFLTGKYRSKKDLEGGPLARARTVSHYLDPRGLDILAELEKIAARLGVTPV